MIAKSISTDRPIFCKYGFIDNDLKIEFIANSTTISQPHTVSHTLLSFLPLSHSLPHAHTL